MPFTNSPTHYLLDYGDFLRTSHKIASKFVPAVFYRALCPLYGPHNRLKQTVIFVLIVVIRIQNYQQDKEICIISREYCRYRRNVLLLDLTFVKPGTVEIFLLFCQKVRVVYFENFIKTEFAKTLAKPQAPSSAKVTLKSWNKFFYLVALTCKRHLTKSKGTTKE